MRTIRVLLQAKPETRERVVAALSAEATEVPSRFAGCERYAVFVDPGDECRVLLYEEWSSPDDFAKYAGSSYFAEMGESLFPMLDGAPDSAYFDSVRVGP